MAELTEIQRRALDCFAKVGPLDDGFRTCQNIGFHLYHKHEFSAGSRSRIRQTYARLGGSIAKRLVDKGVIERQVLGWKSGFVLKGNRLV